MSETQTEQEQLKETYSCLACDNLLTIKKGKDVKNNRCPTCKSNVWNLMSEEFSEEEYKKITQKREEIDKLLKSGKLWDYIVIDELNKKHLGDERVKEILFLCALGRLVKNKKSYSFNVFVNSSSSAGKDNIVLSVLKMFPIADYEIKKRISPKALNYLHTIDKEPNFNYNGKILYLEEIEENVLNTEVMKGFTSGEEEENHSSIVQEKGVKNLTTRGHPCIFTTSATTTATDEIRNRFNIVGLDESPAQTERTFSFESKEYDREIQRFIQNLKPYNVEIPQVIRNFVIKGFPKNKVKYRRAFPKFLDFIRAVTLFNQNERQGKDTDTLTAEWEDYNRARDIFENAYSKLADMPFKDIEQRIIKALTEAQDKPLTAKEIHAEIGGIVAVQNLYYRLTNLKNKEVLEELSLRDVWNNPVSQYVLSEEYKDKSPFKLPLYDFNETLNI